jgi:hypothetical protein
MRYYRIVITDPANGQVITPPGFSADLLGGATYTSFVNGQTLTAAWNVELDIPVIDSATPQGFGLVRVWGISLAEIAQANDLGANFKANKFKNIQIFGGMQKGLPLAKPAQSGLLMSGCILQCFGNWIGTDMTLDFVVMPGPAGSSASSQSGAVGAGPGFLGKGQNRNLVLQWQGGQALAPALTQCLQTGFPGYTVNVKISDKIVSRAGDTPSGQYPTLEQLGQVVRGMSRSIVDPNGTTGYRGVSIVLTGTTINVSDGTTQSGAPTALAFEDLIGQPTWIESPNIQIKAVMRADLSVGSQITLPPAIVTNTSQANSNIFNQRANFQGTFNVISLRHVGNFRQPTADSWVSIIEATPNNPQ